MNAQGGSSTTSAAVTASRALLRGFEVMLTYRSWRSGTIDIESVCARPALGVSPVAFSIEDFLRRSYELVDRVSARVRRVSVAAGLDSLHLR